jgi:hypothetical protein
VGLGNPPTGVDSPQGQKWLEMQVHVSQGPRALQGSPQSQGPKQHQALSTEPGVTSGGPNCFLECFQGLAENGGCYYTRAVKETKEKDMR